MVISVKAIMGTLFPLYNYHVVGTVSRIVLNSEISFVEFTNCQYIQQVITYLYPTNNFSRY